MEKLLVYRGIIIDRTTVMAHGGSGYSDPHNTSLVRDKIIPFKDVNDACRFIKINRGEGRSWWIEKEGEIAHIPNGKTLPWDGSL